MTRISVLRQGLLKGIGIFCFLFPLFFLFSENCLSQSSSDLSNVKVDELTDDQVRRFIIESGKMGLKDDQVEQIALQQGMSPIEIAKFKGRIQAYRKKSGAVDFIPGSGGNTNSSNDNTDSIAAMEQRPLSSYSSLFNAITLKNIGVDVFGNQKITFEPDLKLPTPKNYILAPGDELLIDVSGYSEANYILKVSREGIIRLPVAGPLPVNGLTIEEAKKAIVKRLSNTIYSGIKSGKTIVDVSIGAIRSIKITIIGEATAPGTYTLPSLATAYNALYACGGPNANGSFRNIELVRNGTVMAVIDVYDYLATGNKKNDIRLLDQDVIKINMYDVRVELKGEIKKPGVYDVNKNETLENLFSYAGGFTDNAYTEKIQVFSNTSRERKVSTIPGSQLARTIPGKGDSYIVGKILNRFSNRVSIHGAVYRPGEFELKDGMTLFQLIKEADGLREDAFLSRATIHRLKEDLSPEIVSVDIEKLVKGQITDEPLKREDRITIYSKFDLKEGYYVRIEGEISAPGTFMFEEGMTVQDLIIMAGGLKESAFKKRIEISRRIKNGDSLSKETKTAIIYQQDVNADLRDSSGSVVFKLAPFDEISIRPSPGYFAQKNVVVEGEVIYTGKYTLEAKDNKISDLIKRAGGLTPQAYIQGAVLVRSRNVTRTEQSNYTQGIKNLLKQNYQAGVEEAVLQDQFNSFVQKKSDYVGIDLERIMKSPGSEFDLLLNDGDTLRIPKQLQTVSVNGEVLYPALVRYNKSFRFKDYIFGAGGFSQRSSKKKSYVVYANGTAKGTQSFLFFKNYPKLRPGAEIYIPMKRERERLRTGEIITIGATMVSVLAILTTVLLKK